MSLIMKLAHYIVAIQFLAVAIVLPVVLLHGTAANLHSRSWPVTTATIVDAQVEVHTMNVPSTTRRTYRSLRYTASYSVLDKAYQGRIYYSGDLDDIDYQLAAYPIGSEVRLRYNPDDPRDARFGPHSSMLRMAILSVISLAVLVFAVCIICINIWRFVYRGGQSPHITQPLEQ
ncbi:DUF3592 domain-containing protein [Mucisphaera calidilacus]|uniref:DUF3592 domain-containing protein n=1 Tax=Mucisphaera calidilacus TaxID=2527982 RepID=UPI0011A63421